MSRDYSQYQGQRARRNDFESFEMEFDVLAARAIEYRNNPNERKFEAYIAAQIDTVRGEVEKLSQYYSSTLITLFHEYVTASVEKATKELLAQNVHVERLKSDYKVIELLTPRMILEERQGVGEYHQNNLEKLTTNWIGSLTASSDKEYEGVAKVKSASESNFITGDDMRRHIADHNYQTKFSVTGKNVDSYALYYESKTQRFIPEVYPDDERAESVINTFIRSGRLPYSKQSEVIVEAPVDGELSEFLVQKRNFIRRSVLACVDDEAPTRALFVHVLDKRK